MDVLRALHRFPLFLFLSLQAYTNELEVEVEQLKEENARLKRQQKQVCFWLENFHLRLLAQIIIILRREVKKRQNLGTYYKKTKSGRRHCIAKNSG